MTREDYLQYQATSEAQRIGTKVSAKLWNLTINTLKAAIDYVYSVALKGYQLVQTVSDSEDTIPSGAAVVDYCEQFEILQNKTDTISYGQTPDAYPTVNAVYAEMVHMAQGYTEYRHRIHISTSVHATFVGG